MSIVETTCSNCGREVYENDKCVFHCDKSDWYIEKDGKKSWQAWNKVQDFWSEFENEVIMNKREHDYSYMIFPILTIKKEHLLSSSFFDDNIEYYEITRPIIFRNTVFLDDVYFDSFKFNGVDFSDAIFKGGVSFESSVFSEEKNFTSDGIVLAPEERREFNFANVTCFENIIFDDAEFLCKAVFHGLNKSLSNYDEQYISFRNTKFLKLADYWDASFNIVSFEKTDFEGIVVFTKTIFNHYFEFKFTRFDKQLIMNQTIIKDGFDLHESLYSSDNVVFSEVTFEGKAKHRETYQLIKFLLDQKANYIEANRYYAYELTKQKEDLQPKKWKSLKNFSDWLVFEVHGATSGHGQSWLLPIYWIVISSLFLSSNTYNEDLKDQYEVGAFICLILPSLYLFNIIDVKIAKYLVPIIFGGMLYFEHNSGNVDIFFKYISVFKFEDANHTALFTLNKMLLAYLMYQFVMALRIDTKR